MTLNRHYSVPELRQHALDIARAFGLEVREEEGHVADSSANWMTGVVYVPPIDSEEAYAGTMHEMGHLLHPTGHIPGARAPRFLGIPMGQDNLRLILLEEESAWQWAEHYAIYWTANMEGVKTHAFDSYARPINEEIRLEERAKVEAATPKTESLGSFFDRRTRR